MSPHMSPGRQRRGILRGSGFSHTPIEPLSDSDDDDFEPVRKSVEKSGAIPLLSAGIKVLSDETDIDAVTKERVPYIADGVLSKLIINCLLVVYVP